MCFRLIVANKSRLWQFGKISTDKRADGQKGAIGKILFGAATGGRADG